MKHAPTEVLLVEDNPGDVVLLTEAIEYAGFVVRLMVVENGQEALAFLDHRSRQADACLPGLIVLDLNLPVMSGHEVLAELAAAPRFHDIPVAVLTTSKTETEICGNHPEGRCRYFVKSGDFKLLIEIVREMLRFARSAAAPACGSPQPVPPDLPS